MKKVYSIDGLKCGHCASKIQDQIGKLKGVDSCVLNFYTKKLTLEMDSSLDTPEFLSSINKIADKTERGSKISDINSSKTHHSKEHSHEHKHGESCSCGHDHSHGHEHKHGEKCGCGGHTHEHKHGEECGCGGHHHEEGHECGCGHNHDDDSSGSDEEGCCTTEHHHNHSHEHHHHEESCSCGHDHSHEHEHKEEKHSHSHGHSHSHDINFKMEESHEEHEKFNYEKFSLFGGLALFIISFIVPTAALKTIVLIAAYLIAGGDILYKSLINIKNRNFLDENFLMSIATIGALFLREYKEAVGVMIFYKIGEYFQERAVNNSRKSIQSLLEVKANYANIKLPNGETKQVDPETLEVNDIIVIKPGEKVPVDGVVVKGISSLNTAALTGESLPVSAETGTEILSGSLNIDGLLEVKVTKEYKDSTISKIIEMVESASDKKANSEKFITKFARYYTPIVVLAAVIVGIVVPLIFGDFKLWFGRALIFLVISCPCALVLSVPLTFFSSIGLSSKRGILIKGGNYLEKLTEVDAVVFDKTGTLTKGKFRIESLNNAEEFTQNELLEIGKAGEFYSNHPIGKAVLNHGDIKISEQDIKDYKEISGKGVSAVYKGKHILAGNRKLMADYNISGDFPNTESTTLVYVAQDGKFAGSIYLADEIKNDSIFTISELGKMGLKTYMLTGDNKNIGQTVGEKLGFEKENVFTQLLPQDKVSIMEDIKKKSKGVIFVGDGINDAPVLSLADVGIAMGGAGSDIAVESADIVFIHDEPSKVVETLKIAAENKKVVMQNIYFSLGVKILVMLLGVAGIANMWMAIFADVGVSAIAVLNASKILRIKKL